MRTTYNNTGDFGDFLNYNNSVYGRKIRYPAFWSCQDGVNAATDTVIDIVYLYPPIVDDPNALTFLQIGTWDLDRKRNDIDLLCRNAINCWRGLCQEFKLISATAQTTLATSRAYEIVYRGIFEGFNLESMQTGTIYDNKVYYVLFSAEIERYESFVRTVLFIDTLEANSLAFT